MGFTKASQRRIQALGRYCRYRVLRNALSALCVRFMRYMWRNTAIAEMFDAKTHRHSDAGIKWSADNIGYNLCTVSKCVGSEVSITLCHLNAAVAQKLLHFV